jgi:hypothetical protein
VRLSRRQAERHHPAAWGKARAGDAQSVRDQLIRPSELGGRVPGAYDAANPANALKLEAADALGAVADEAGMTVIQMAVAFAVRHPAVTSAIIGPRTVDHLDAYLAADWIELSVDSLDQIDRIVPPGVTVNVADNMWNVGTRALDAGARRR